MGVGVGVGVQGFELLKDGRGWCAWGTQRTHTHAAQHSPSTTIPQVSGGFWGGGRWEGGRYINGQGVGCAHNIHILKPSLLFRCLRRRRPAVLLLPPLKKNTDIVTLLCLRNARSGGLSSWSSSISVHNEILRRAPHLAQALAGPDWYYDRKGEVRGGQEVGWGGSGGTCKGVSGLLKALCSATTSHPHPTPVPSDPALSRLLASPPHPQNQHAGAPRQEALLPHPCVQSTPP